MVPPQNRKGFDGYSLFYSGRIKPDNDDDGDRVMKRTKLSGSSSEVTNQKFYIITITITYL